MGQTLSREQAEASLATWLAKGGRADGHVRKAYAALGDDTTLSRFVKLKRLVTFERKPKQLSLGTLRHRAFEMGRSLFGNSVRQVQDVTSVLVSGHSNVKIGRDVRKGKLFRGYWIFTLTLEERATCPRTCFHWNTCYGNHMPYAKRISHQSPEALEAAIERDIRRELGRKGRKGVLVRLHALGDFYDSSYVWFWSEMLRKYPRLAVWGYTAHRPDSEVGVAITRLKSIWGKRFAVRWSNGTGDTDCAVPVLHPDDCPPTAFVCPEQTGKTAACATCGLCWNTDKNVAFVEH
jgi:hypothetical protein